MAKRVQIVRHDTSGLATFTGLVGEVTVNTTKNTIVVHDGATAGGQEMAKEDLSDTQNATNATAGKMSAAHVTQQETNTADIAAAQADILTNAANIATNVSAIATNAANIATNAADIIINAADISTNAANISLNDTDISTLQSGKANKVGSPTNNNIVAMDAGGDIKDSGESLTDIHDATNLTGIVPAANLSDASETVEGIVELATQAEVDTGTDAVRVVTPATLKNLAVTAVTGYTLGKYKYLKTNLTSSGLNIRSALAVSTWESIGPTGSSASNIWTDMDGIPANAVSVRLRILTRASGAVLGTIYSISVYGRKTGETDAVSNINTVGNAEIKNDGGADTRTADYKDVDILLDANNRFDLYYSETGTQTAYAYVIGFSTN